MTIDKNKLLKTIGWTSVGVGLYLIGISTKYDNATERVRPDDGIIDAEFTIIND
jgi:hypothetical protein